MTNTARQTRRPVKSSQSKAQSGAGMGVDVYGGPVIDPTENVLSLVDVEKAHARELRAADLEHDRDLRTAEARYQDGMRQAEKEKQEALAVLKQGYDKQISDILTVQVKTTSELISTQLDKVTTSLSNQINAARQEQIGLIGTLSERIGRLEQNQWQTSGKASVSDPATAEALSRMATSITSLSASTADAMNKTAFTNAEALSKLATGIAALQTGSKVGEGQRMGQGQVVAWIVAAVMLMASIVSPIIAYNAMKPSVVYQPNQSVR